MFAFNVRSTSSEHASFLQGQFGEIKFFFERLLDFDFLNYFVIGKGTLGDLSLLGRLKKTALLFWPRKARGMLVHGQPLHSKVASVYRMESQETIDKA